MKCFKFRRTILLAESLVCIFCQKVIADGSTIDKVYDPYVQLLEHELEYRTLYTDNNGSQFPQWLHKLGYGQSLNDRWLAEGYLILIDDNNDSLKLEGYELEFKWQLTEQGEFNNDWGLLFELEREKSQEVWEASSTLIMLHEWSDWIATGNLSLIYEWRDDIDNEWETAFSGQLRYRFSQAFEPALEIYKSQQSSGLGPVATGLWRLGSGSKINWELGAIFGLEDETPDVNWKLVLEYEY